LSDVIQNLEEWKVHGEYYRISFAWNAGEFPFKNGT
jgi:hypothetical protein